MRSKYTFAGEQHPPMNFKHGFFLQALNPKAIIFGLTIYTTFLASINQQPVVLMISTLSLAVVTFFSVSLWAFTGVQIQGYLHNEKVQKYVNGALGLLLVYCAIGIFGI